MKKYILFIAVALITMFSFGQSAPQVKAIDYVELTTAQRDALPDPPAGIVRKIFNLTTGVFEYKRGAAAWSIFSGGGGATTLGGLTDVVSAPNTNRFALMANGTTGYEGRALTEADISDLQPYITSFTESDPTFTTWQPTYDAHAANGGIHFLQSAISITELQISDLSHTVDTKNPLSDNISTVSSTTSASSTAVKSVNDKVNTNLSDIANKEDALGNPITNGYVLSSQTDGTRSWVVNGAGSADGSETKINAGTNTTVTGTGTIADPYVVNSAGGSTTVIDNLNSTSGIDALSAGQGKVLDDKITAITVGTGNPNIFVPTTLTDFTTPDAGNANKIWEIQSDLDFLANNVTLLAGVTLKDGGGSITGTGTLTYTETSFDIEDKYKMFIDGNSLTFAGTPKLEFVSALNFGFIDDAVSSRFDNRQAGFNVLFIANQNGGTFWIPFGYNFWTSVVDSESRGPFDAPFNWAVGNFGNNVTITGGGAIHILPYDFRRSNAFEFYETNNSVIDGIEIYGERYEHGFTQYFQVTTGASSTANLDVQVFEYETFAEIASVREDVVSIPLVAGTQDATAQQITDYINTNASFSSYTATNEGTGKIRIDHATAGQDFRFRTPDNGTSGIDINDAANTHEWGYGVSWGSNADNCKAINNKVWDFHGDGFAADMQNDGKAALTEADWTRGGIVYNDQSTNITEDDTVVFTPDVGGAEVYTTAIRDISGYAEDWFYFSQNALSSYLPGYTTYYAYFYDVNDNFLYRSKELEAWQKIEHSSEVEGVRISMVYTVNMFSADNVDGNSLYMFIDPRKYNKGSVISYNDIGFNRRQAISNPAFELTMIGNQIHDTGGTGPEYGFDPEDYGKFSYALHVERNYWYNNRGGDGILKGTRETIWKGNHHLADTKPMKRPTTFANALSMSWGRNTIASENFFHGKSVSVTFQGSFNDNVMFGGSLNLEGSGVNADNNRLQGTLISGNSDLGLAKMTNTLLQLDRNWVGSIFDTQGVIDVDGLTIEGNTRTSLHFTDNITFPLVEVDNVSNMQARASTAPVDRFHLGGVKRLNVLDLEPTDNSKYSQAMELYAQDAYDVNSTMPITFYGGGTRSFTFEKFKTIGALNLELVNFTNTKSGTYETVKIKDGIVDISDDLYLYNRSQGTLSSTSALLTTEKDINLEVEDVVFNIPITYGLDGVTPEFPFNRDLFVQLYHNGTSDFKNVTFNYEGTGYVLDLTDTAHVLATTGDITFTDCTFNGLTVTLRAGDAIVSTQGSGMSNIVEDLTPQLGGNLDPNGNDIDFFNAVFNVGDVGANNNTTVLRVNDVTGVIEMTASSVTKNGSEIVDRAYGDANYLGGGGITEIVQDLTPQFGGNVDAQGFNLDSIQDMTFKNALNTFKFNGGLPLIKHVEFSANGDLGRFTFSKFNDGGSGGTIMTIEEDVIFPSASYNNNFLQSNMFVTKDWINKNDFILNLLEITTTSYTLIGELFASYAGISKTIEFNNASDITVTVPLNASDVMDIGTRVVMIQKGVGQIIISPEVGVTINTSETLKSEKQRARIILIKTSTDEWTLFGDLEPLSNEIKEFMVSLSAPTGNLTTGVKETVYMPYGLEITDIKFSSTVAPTGSSLILDIKENGVTIFSTLVSIDVTENGSWTAAAPYVLTDTTLSENSEITFDITQVGSTLTGEGIKIAIIGTKI